MKTKKIIMGLLIICWMITIFMFSNQGSDKSSKTSKGSIRFILDKLSITKNMEEQQIEELIEKLQTPIRKLAHFSIYTLGGILTSIYFSLDKKSKRKSIIEAILFCSIYAITDEIHQYFIPGRSCELRDILIDSSGALFGILITQFILKILPQKEKI